MKPMTYYTYFSSPVGNITAVCRDGAITHLRLEGQREIPLTQAARKDDEPVLLELRQWLEDYFAGKNPDAPSLPLVPSGTPFQMAVWEKLRQIPYGQTVTYGQIARSMGKERMSAQAVGQAVGRNPISILIPCHRVIGANGSLTGYDGGITKKITLLTLEGSMPNIRSTSK